jgi:hypothetical protein
LVQTSDREEWTGSFQVVAQEFGLGFKRPQRILSLAKLLEALLEEVNDRSASNPVPILNQ